MIPDTPIRLGDLAIDLHGGSVLRAGRPVALTPLEWRILGALARRQGQTLTRAELAAAFDGHAMDPTDNAIGVHLYNIRRKLGKDSIQTIRGRGFRLSR